MQEIVYHSNFELENKYWWFTARNFILKKLINKHIKLEKNSNVLDVGCGTGGFAEILSKNFNVICIDTSETALNYCKLRRLNKLFNITIEEFEAIKQEPINLITMLDVVEHIEDDKSVIASAHRIIQDEGYILITVPAYQWLWSSHDEMHMHKRRYTKKQIIKLLKNNGFNIIFSSYFNSLLFLPGLIKRFIDNLLKRKNNHPVDEVSPMINSLFESIFKLESSILNIISIPFGMSIVVIAKK